MIPVRNALLIHILNTSWDLYMVKTAHANYASLHYYTIISPPILLIYIRTQDLLPGGINSNCLRNAQDYYVDLITLSIESPTIGIVCLIML